MLKGLLLLFTLFSLLLAEEKDTDIAVSNAEKTEQKTETNKEIKPAVETLENGKFRLGEMIFDAKTRHIEIPAEVNMNEGLLEFLLVHVNGKTHESLFATKISALNLNIIFKLLNYKSSPAMYLNQNDDGSLGTGYQKGSPEQWENASLTVMVRYKDKDSGKELEVNACDWIMHLPDKKEMKRDPWVYGGSGMFHGRFIAEVEGDLIANFQSNSALINYSGADHDDDGVWPVYPDRVPPVGTPVTLIIKPYTK